MPPPRRTGRLGWGPGTRTQKCRRKCGEWGGCSPSGLFTFGSPFLFHAAVCCLVSSPLSHRCFLLHAAVHHLVFLPLSRHCFLLHAAVHHLVFLPLSRHCFLLHAAVHHLVVLPLSRHCFLLHAVFIQGGYLSSGHFTLMLVLLSILCSVCTVFKTDDGLKKNLFFYPDLESWGKMAFLVTVLQSVGTSW